MRIDAYVCLKATIKNLADHRQIVIVFIVKQSKTFGFKISSKKKQFPIYSCFFFE